MLKKLLFITAITLSSTTFAQAPQKMSYQAVVRDASTNLVASSPVGMRLSIHQGTAAGLVVYSETQTVTSNANGLVSLVIGDGAVVSGDLTTIDWSTGMYFIQSETDVTGGTTYTITGTSQLLSVPYALYAENAGVPGVAGPMGPAGADGAVGPAGADGAVGPAGADGAVGPAGAAGADGADGAVGPAGAAGADGAVGPAGADGAVGAQGPAGADGAAGTAGATGPAGADGAVGPAGADGAVGAAGPTGADGAVGPAGATGPAGAANMTGTTDYVVKFTGATTGGNSTIRDNGTGVAINAAPSNLYQLYTYDSQLTVDGDGQATIYGYRTRDSQNDGIGYSTFGTNSGVLGYNYWGDIYTFGVTGTSYNDYTRTGGVLGAETSGTYWGSLGYKNSGSATFGVYGSAGYASGAGLLPTTEFEGIGGGFYGGVVGSISKGAIIGQLNSGELFSSYNSGNTYTKGKNVEMVENNGSSTPMYAVTSTEVTMYAKGAAQLVNGEAFISFENNYANLLGENPIVTVSPNGNCNGVYIASVSKKGFTVKEMNAGTSNVQISWISIGNRIDNRMDAATELVSSPNFDRNIQQVLFDDGNKEGSAKGIWWDGTTVQFGVLPESLSKVVRSEK
jgi:hypothetical protein